MAPAEGPVLAAATFRRLCCAACRGPPNGGMFNFMQTAAQARSKLSLKETSIALLMSGSHMAAEACCNILAASKDWLNMLVNASLESSWSDALVEEMSLKLSSRLPASLCLRRISNAIGPVGVPAAAPVPAAHDAGDIDVGVAVGVPPCEAAPCQGSCGARPGSWEAFSKSPLATAAGARTAPGIVGDGGADAPADAAAAEAEARGERGTEGNLDDNLADCGTKASRPTNRWSICRHSPRKVSFSTLASTSDGVGELARTGEALRAFHRPPPKSLRPPSSEMSAPRPASGMQARISALDCCVPRSCGHASPVSRALLRLGASGKCRRLDSSARSAPRPCKGRPARCSDFVRRRPVPLTSGLSPS
mmetsp:Transcript_33100/g.84156  ORF Transcript_33100/g.84156 Transcript_33100/m.84156 type:complete len:364 (-) Transcript_33100:197-1288(-)